MQLTLKRRYFGETYTIGSLSIDGEYFCDTLEDRYRDLAKESKVRGSTAIPLGTYRLELTYSPKFKRVLPLLLNVPHFEGVRIHRGNTEKDTEGCPLVGENKVKGKVINSAVWEEKLMAALRAAVDRGEKITIEIVR